jgi:hypothetical protein
MVNPTRAKSSAPGVILMSLILGGAEISILVIREFSLTDMYNILFTDIEPVNWKTKLWVITADKS